MKNININFRSYLSMPDRVQENHEEAEQIMGKDQGSFDMLLDRIKGIRSEGDLHNTALPLGRDRLRQLIEILQIQMNNYLFNVLSDFDEDNEFPGFQLDSVNFHGIESGFATSVSKIEHASQKTKQGESETRFGGIINHASIKYGVDPELIKAVIKAESDFDANCTSPKGAMGLMQLMPETAKELGVKNCYSPVENITAGTCYLKNLLDRYDGNIPLALAAYNWGMGNVERHPDKLPQETRTYIARINEILNKEIL
ncbi:MAG: lytic transglycosylase domain-containing protein [Deltaproteobacteria bacterium]|nr:lytic transglycosylase domain-containing protein [Deltaproteobacteria bacterium]